MALKLSWDQKYYENAILVQHRRLSALYNKKGTTVFSICLVFFWVKEWGWWGKGTKNRYGHIFCYLSEVILNSFCYYLSLICNTFFFLDFTKFSLLCLAFGTVIYTKILWRFHLHISINILLQKSDIQIFSECLYIFTWVNDKLKYVTTYTFNIQVLDKTFLQKSFPWKKYALNIAIC